MFKNKKSVILLIYMLVVGVGFWSISRYPQLEGKRKIVERGVLSESKMIQGKITRGDRFGEFKQDSVLENIYRTTLNWIFANWRGMSFGVVMGAAFLSFFRISNVKGSSNRYVNSFYGMITGIPLGVCSNCVAPIMKGTFEGKGKMEYSLATMFSSPMLNIVVLVILFSTFPIAMALLNVMAVLFLVLVIVPIFSAKRSDNIALPDFCELNVVNNDKLGWLEEFLSVSKVYLKDLGFLFIRVVPLMLFAGFLGGVMVNMVDPEKVFSGVFDKYWPLLIVLAGFFAAFLPMPIAIDLMLAQSLMVVGVPLPIIAVFIFALGSYSIYSFIIVRQTFNLKIAAEIYLIVVLLSSFLGFINYLIYGF